MGLDSIWVMPATGDVVDGVIVEKEHPVFEPPLQLVTGILCNEGITFRGKVYDSFIDEISGISLYQVDMSNKDVKDIADALEKLALDADLLSKFDISSIELADLQRMFRTYADAGAILHGWW